MVSINLKKEGGSGQPQVQVGQKVDKRAETGVSVVEQTWASRVGPSSSLKKSFQSTNGLVGLRPRQVSGENPSEGAQWISLDKKEGDTVTSWSTHRDSVRTRIKKR